MNKYIETLAQRCALYSTKPVWFWRNILRWRWDFAKINRRQITNVEEFMTSTVPNA